jgi:hypothetical protein
VEPDFPSRSKLRVDMDEEIDFDWDGKIITKPDPPPAVIKNWTLANVVQIIYAASLDREDLTVYGLERVKVLRGFQYPFFDTGETPPHRYKWHNRRHRSRAYGRQELTEMVQHYVNELLSREAEPQEVRFRFHTIEEYLATCPVDELFLCELEPNARTDTKWLASNYWKSKTLWRKSAMIPELAEGGYYEEDTDEEDIRFKRPKPLNFNPKEEKRLRKRQKYEERLTSKNLGL